MSYAGIFGLTGLPRSKKKNKEDLLNVLLDKEVDKDVRFVSLMLALWSNLISLEKAEELLVDIGIMDTEALINAYEKLNETL